MRISRVKKCFLDIQWSSFWLTTQKYIYFQPWILMVLREHLLIPSMYLVVLTSNHFSLISLTFYFHHWTFQDSGKKQWEKCWLEPRFSSFLGQNLHHVRPPVGDPGCDRLDCHQPICPLCQLPWRCQGCQLSLGWIRSSDKLLKNQGQWNLLFSGRWICETQSRNASSKRQQALHQKEVW